MSTTSESPRLDHAGGRDESTSTSSPARLTAVALPACTVLGGLGASAITAASGLGAELGPATTWTVSAYFVGAGLSAVAAGRIADQVGARRVVLGGLTLVIVASLLGALAGTGWWLVATRVVLGAATAAVYPPAVVLVRRLYPPGTGQVSGLGLISLASAAGFAAGPSIGALLNQLGGWRLVAAVLLGPALAAAVLVLHAIPRDPATPEAPRAVLGQLDLPGLGLLAAAACAALLWLQSPSLTRWYLPATATGVLAVFLLWERRHPRPVLPARIMTWPLVAVYLRAISYYGTLYLLILALPVWLSEVYGLPASSTAAVMITLPVMTVVASVLTPAPIGRLGLRTVLLTGATLLAAAAVGLGQVSAHSPLPLIVATIALIGVSSAIVNIAQQSALVHATPSAFTGTCSGLYGLLQLMAGAGAALVVELGLRTASHLALPLALVLIIATVTDRADHFRPR